jgi:hypothetical protein
MLTPVKADDGTGTSILLLLLLPLLLLQRNVMSCGKWQGRSCNAQAYQTPSQVKQHIVLYYTWHNYDKI